MTAKEFREMAQKQPRTKRKYNNRPTEIDGIMFDSEKEARRWKELKLLESLGEISELERQKKFELQPAFRHEGHRIQPINYICDFYYRQGDKYIVEDVKSPVTANNQVYRIKKKMMMYRGYDIREI